MNEIVNEFSAIYWVWKNTKSDYVGFYHYSKYFGVPDYPEMDSSNYVKLGKSNHILTIDRFTDSIQRRAIDYICEKLLTVWLMKQNLRIKTLKIFQSSKADFQADQFLAYDLIL